MRTQNYEFQSEFARKYTALGQARGEEIGEARGKEIGEARGRAIGEALAVVTVLEARGLVVSPTQRDRILSCTDLVTIEQWVRRAIKISSTDELFA